MTEVDEDLTEDLPDWLTPVSFEPLQREQQKDAKLKELHTQNANKTQPEAQAQNADSKTQNAENATGRATKVCPGEGSAFRAAGQA